MSDEYICSICGHRAGDHAVSNRCLAVDCDCKDDPYDEQLDILRKQLIELQADKVELISQRDNWIGLVMDKNKRLEVALTDLHDTTAQLVKYIDQEGIVVEFPETTSQKIIAVIAYAETLKHDCLLAEKQLDIAEHAMMRANLVVPMTDIGIRNFHILDDALAEIERIGGTKC